MAKVEATRTFYIDPIMAEADPQPEALAWGIIDTKANQFWTTFGVQGQGIVQANIDTGVQWDHPALVGAFKCPGDPGNAACWRDPSNICPGGTACDNNGHGTHVMGSQAGSDNPSLTWQAGMAPASQWIACKGCESSSCSQFALETCADWIVAPAGNPNNRPHVVNNSWGGGSACDGWYHPKVTAWRAAGTVPAFSAGNAGSGCNSLGQPSNYQDSFATAAHDVNRNIASFSSRGPAPQTGPCHPYDPYTKPNISSPGVNVCSSVPGNGWSCGYSGTSMSSPHTAGAVALLLSCNPSLIGQMAMIFEALQDNADAPPTGGNCGAPPTGNGNYTWGYGPLNILATGMMWCGDVEFGYLDGYVRDATTLAPIEGANVSAAPGYGPLAVTDPTGYYTMSLVPGTYNVTASATGYAPQTVSGIVIVTDTVTSQDFALTYQGQWMPGPSMCFDLTRFDAGYYPDGWIYVMGGRSGATTVGTIYRFNPETGVCQSTGASMPAPISNYSMNLVTNASGDLVFCTFGGRDSAGTQTLAVQCYNPVTNAASQVATLPSDYTGYTPAAQAVVANHVYVFGGFNPSSSPYELVRTDRFNPLNNTFTQVGNLTLGRGYIDAAAVDGAIYAFGGTAFDGTNLNAQVRTEVMADPGGAGTWDNPAVAELPTASAEGRAFGFDPGSPYGVENGVVLVGGGQWPGNTNLVRLYDIASDSYDATFPNLITARRNHAGAFVSDCVDPVSNGLPGMWVFGGRDQSDNPPYAPAEYYPLDCAEPGPPTASFTSDSPVCLGEAMQFTDTSGGNPPVNDWLWDLGDDLGTSTAQHPVYTYTAAGDYEVTLWVTNTAGSDWTMDTVTVNPLPEASFEYAPDTGLLPLTVYFTNTSEHAANPTWDFGDGNGDTGDYVHHTYATTGTFTVVLTVDSPYGCGQDEAESEIYVYFEMPPEASFAADPEMGCGAPLVVQFTDTSLAVPPVHEWLWHFGDGEMSTAQHPEHTYAEVGEFVVTLWVTNTLGSDMVTGTIHVHPLPLAMFDYEPTMGFAPLLVTFTNTSMYGEDPVWDLGDGNMGAGDEVTHTYELTGTFTVMLTVTSPYGCGEATASAQVTVYEPGTCIPVTIVEVTQAADGCVVDFGATLTGDPPFTYLWSFALGTFDVPAPQVDFGATGVYTGTLEAWNCDGDGYDTHDFTVDVTCDEPPPPVFKIYLPLIVK